MFDHLRDRMSSGTYGWPQLLLRKAFPKTKTDELSEKFQTGFDPPPPPPILSPNFRGQILQIFAIISLSSVMNSGDDFPIMRGRGGSKAVWNFSESSSVLEM